MLIIPVKSCTSEWSIEACHFLSCPFLPSPLGCYGNNGKIGVVMEAADGMKRSGHRCCSHGSGMAPSKGIPGWFNHHLFDVQSMAASPLLLLHASVFETLISANALCFQLIPPPSHWSGSQVLHCSGNIPPMITMVTILSRLLWLGKHHR